MVEPWKPIEAMEPDEIRRYAHDLMVALAALRATDRDHRELVPINYIAAVEARMESLGIDPMIRLRRDWL